MHKKLAVAIEKQGQLFPLPKIIERLRAIIEDPTTGKITGKGCGQQLEVIAEISIIISISLHPFKFQSTAAFSNSHHLFFQTVYQFTMDI